MTAPGGPPPSPGRRIDPMVGVVLGVAVGIVIALQRPRIGMYVVTGSIGMAALLRLLLRPTAAGSLVVRRRQVDVAVLAGLTVALAVLAAVTPFHGKG